MCSFYWQRRFKQFFDVVIASWLLLYLTKIKLEVDLTAPCCCFFFAASEMICDGTLYGIRPFVACLPAWFRFAQCLRRYKDTRQAFPHLVNAGKYSTAFFVVVFSTLGKNSLIQKLAFHREGVVNYQLHVKFIFPPFLCSHFLPFCCYQWRFLSFKQFRYEIQTVYFIKINFFSSTLAKILLAFDGKIGKRNANISSDSGAGFYGTAVMKRAWPSG